jgi:CheY-like chemotaxis protein
MPVELPYILVVDDDPDDQELICTALAEIGGIFCKVISNGEGVIDFLNRSILKDGLPSLIVLDFNMPRINGDRVLSLIKRNENYKDLPVLIYSTYLSDQISEILISQGAMGCYVKPANYSMLLNQIEFFKKLALEFHKKQNMKLEFIAQSLISDYGDHGNNRH